MPQSKIEKISEGAYFVFEPSSFNGSLTPYNALVANQTILYDSQPEPIESQRATSYTPPASSTRKAGAIGSR